MSQWALQRLARFLTIKSFTEDSEGSEGSSVSILQRGLVIAGVFRSGQNHADNAILQNRLVKVNQQSDRDIQQLHVAKKLRFAGRMQNFDGL
jgi:hypothetical protein